MENKVTQEELTQLLSFKHKYDELSFRYGKIEFAIRALTKEQKAIDDEFDQVSQQELEFFKKLNEKYGESQIDLETGEISNSE